MTAYEIVEQLEYIQGANFAFQGIGEGGRRHSNEMSEDKVRGCCALGAFKLAYSGTEHGLEALRYTMSELRKRGFKNIVAFGDVSTKAQVAAFYREIGV